MNMMAELKDLRHGGVLRAEMRIAGELVGGARTIDVRNPYTGSVVGTVPKATVEDVRRAFAIARGYKPVLTRHDRFRILHRTADIIRGRTAEISDLITAECGICKKDSLYEVGPRLRRVHLRRQRRIERRRPDLLLRSDPARQEAQGVYAARAAAGRHRRNHAVQSSAEPGRAQGRPVDRDQQPDGAEAHREDATDRAAARRHPLRGRPAAARCSR